MNIPSLKLFTCSISSVVWLWPPSVGVKNRSSRALSPRRSIKFSIPRNCKSSNSYSISSFVAPEHITWGMTGMPYLCWIAAAMATVPGRRRILWRSNSPSSRSWYTNSLWWVVMFMKLGLNSLSWSILRKRDAVPLPFKGGRTSNEKCFSSVSSFSNCFISVMLLPIWLQS